MKKKYNTHYKLKLNSRQLLKWWINYQIQETGDFEPTLTTFYDNTGILRAEISRARGGTVGTDCKLYRWVEQKQLEETFFDVVK